MLFNMCISYLVHGVLGMKNECDWSPFLQVLEPGSAHQVSTSYSRYCILYTTLQAGSRAAAGWSRFVVEVWGWNDLRAVAHFVSRCHGKPQGRRWRRLYLADEDKRTECEPSQFVSSREQSREQRAQVEIASWRKLLRPKSPDENSSGRSLSISYRFSDIWLQRF